jgi:hypothetical protein
MRRLAVFVSLLCVAGAAACGGSDSSADARKAAQSYVSTLGKRDGAGTCALMTKPLQQQFTAAVVRSDARFKGRTCPQIMQAALDTIPPDQLRDFSRAKIADLKLDGDSGTFRYTLGRINVDGKVAKENGDWKVSCCVPGSGSG